MANRKIKNLPDIAAKVHNCFYKITHSPIPMQIKDIENLIKRASFVYPKQSMEKRMFVKEMKDKVREFFITNHNT